MATLDSASANNDIWPFGKTIVGEMFGEGEFEECAL
jgi:hypothetical protein